MKHCTDCKWHDPDQYRHHRIKAASLNAANATTWFGTQIEPMDDDVIRALSESNEAEYVYTKWEMMMPFTCGHSMVVRPENGKRFDTIHQARQFCGYRNPEHWEKQTELVKPWRMEAYEKTFEIIKERIERSVQVEEEFFSNVQESSIFQRIKNWFGI